MERQFLQQSRGNLTTRLLGTSLDTILCVSSCATYTAEHWDNKMKKACSLPLRSLQARRGDRCINMQLMACSESDIEKLSVHLVQN